MVLAAVRGVIVVEVVDVVGSVVVEDTVVCDVLEVGSALPALQAAARTITNRIVIRNRIPPTISPGGPGSGILDAMTDLRDHVSGRLGSEIVEMSQLSGGDVAQAYRVALADGRTVFAKTKSDAPPGFFITEAHSLSWLRDALAVNVPEVIDVSDTPAALILEWIEPGRPAPGTEPDLGYGLAALHAAGADSFGRQDRRSTGKSGPAQ